MRPVALALAGGLVAGSLAVSAAPAHAVPSACDSIDIETSTDEVGEVDEPGPPLAELQVTAAQDKVRELTGKEPGAGVTVAVLDSGVVPDDTRVPTPGAVVDTEAAKQTALEYYHGTAVAGLINGQDLADDVPVGIAPAAAVVDVRVYDVGPDGEDEDSSEVDADGVAEGLTKIQSRIKSGEIRIVTIAVDVSESASLKTAVRKATKAGAVIVASSGNRGETGHEAGEDAADEVYPAGFDDPLVVGVSTTPREGASATDYVLQSSAIDVAVPTADAITYAVNGSGCSFGEPSTSAAAGEVAGVLALLMTAYPDETAGQIVRRLEATATGSANDDPDRPDKLIGHGVVQPLEALTRAPGPADDGSGPDDMRDDEAEPATLPEPEPDVLESTRRNAVWWGLIGGGALVVAVLLRPVLSRRHKR